MSDILPRTATIEQWVEQTNRLGRYIGYDSDSFAFEYTDGHSLASDIEGTSIVGSGDDGTFNIEFSGSDSGNFGQIEVEIEDAGSGYAVNDRVLIRGSQFEGSDSSAFLAGDDITVGITSVSGSGGITGIEQIGDAVDIRRIANHYSRLVGWLGLSGTPLTTPIITQINDFIAPIGPHTGSETISEIVNRVDGLLGTSPAGSSTYISIINDLDTKTGSLPSTEIPAGTTVVSAFNTLKSLVDNQLDQFGGVIGDNIAVNASSLSGTGTEADPYVIDVYGVSIDVLSLLTTGGSGAATFFSVPNPGAGNWTLTFTTNDAQDWDTHIRAKDGSTDQSTESEILDPTPHTLTITADGDTDNIEIEIQHWFNGTPTSATIQIDAPSTVTSPRSTITTVVEGLNTAYDILAISNLETLYLRRAGTSAMTANLPVHSSGLTSGNNNLLFFAGTANPALTISTTGRVGIGTRPPISNYLVDANGTVNATTLRYAGTDTDEKFFRITGTTALSAQRSIPLTTVDMTVRSINIRPSADFWIGNYQVSSSSLGAQGRLQRLVGDMFSGNTETGGVSVWRATDKASIRLAGSHTDVVSGVVSSHEHTNDQITDLTSNVQSITGGMVDQHSDRGFGVVYDSTNQKLNFDSALFVYSTIEDMINTVPTGLTITRASDKLNFNYVPPVSSVQNEVAEMLSSAAGSAITGTGTQADPYIVTSFNTSIDITTLLSVANWGVRTHFVVNNPDPGTWTATFTTDSSQDWDSFFYAQDGTTNQDTDTETIDFTPHVLSVAADGDTDNLLLVIRNYNGTNRIPNAPTSATLNIRNPVAALSANGITVSYNNISNKIDFDIDDFDLILSGGITGTETITSLANTTINATLDPETVQDLVGEMVSGNTETGISVTYDDTAGKLNFDVGETVQDIIGEMVETIDPSDPLTPTGTGTQADPYVISRSVTDLDVASYLTDTGWGATTYFSVPNPASGTWSFTFDTDTGQDWDTFLDAKDGNNVDQDTDSEATDFTPHILSVDANSDTANLEFQVRNYTNAAPTTATLTIAGPDSSITATYDDTAGKLNFVNNVTTADVQTAVQSMITGNTETGITVSYDTTNNNIDFDASPAIQTIFTDMHSNVTNPVITSGSGKINFDAASRIQAITEAMISGNTESGITVSAASNKLNFTIGNASDSARGIAEIATTAEHTASAPGGDRISTPAEVKKEIDRRFAAHTFGSAYAFTAYSARPAATGSSVTATFTGTEPTGTTYEWQTLSSGTWSAASSLTGYQTVTCTARADSGWMRITWSFGGDTYYATQNLPVVPAASGAAVAPERPPLAFRTVIDKGSGNLARVYQAEIHANTALSPGDRIRCIADDGVGITIYRWQKRNNSNASWGRVNINDATYTIPANAANGWEYRLNWNRNGQWEEDSSGAYLTVGTTYP